MKRTVFTVLAVGAYMGAAMCASAQFGGLVPIKRPNIANIFHPVAGQGASYEETGSDGRKFTMELSVVGQDTVNGQAAYWLEFGRGDASKLQYGKALVTPADFTFHKIVIQQPGQPQPIEMDMDARKAPTRENLEKSLDKWHSVGTETITVPAGTFSCEHWTKDEGKGDIWVSSKVSPMGMVKSVDEGKTMVLVKLITDAKTHITGTPVQFDPQMMMRQRMGQQHP